jgi:hypothetical protein
MSLYGTEWRERGYELLRLSLARNLKNQLCLSMGLNGGSVAMD